MVGSGMFDGVFNALIIIVIAIFFVVGVSTYGITSCVKDVDEISVDKPLKPSSIEIFTKDGVTDTIYIYKIK